MKEVREEQYSAKIPPSNIAARVGAGFRSHFFHSNPSSSDIDANELRHLFLSYNPPPLDARKEGATEQDKLLANSGTPTLETVLVDFMNKQDKRDRKLILKTSLLTAAITGGAVAAVDRLVLAAESEDINSFPNSFNDTRLVDDRLVPRADANKDEIFDDAAEKGEIERDNILYLTQEEINALPKDDESGNPLFLFPLALDPKDNIKYDRDSGIVSLHNVKAGTPIIAGHDGYALTWYSLIRGKDGKRIPAPAGKTYGIDITFIGSDGNAHMFVVDTSGNAANPDSLLNSLENIPSMGPSNSNGRDFTKGLLEKRGDVVGYINEDIDLLQLQLGVRKMDGKELNPMEAIPKRLNFVTQNGLAPKLYVVKPEAAKTLSK